MMKAIKHKSKALIVLLLALTILAMAGCASRSDGNKTPSEASSSGKGTEVSDGGPFTLRVVDPPYDYLEFVSAWELGFFRDAGIESNLSAHCRLA